MRLFFILPGDRIKLLQDETFTKCADGGTAFSNWDSMSKGTVLEVSQVYIRKNGWFDSSLTFKVVEGPDVMRSQLQKLNNLHEYYEKVIKMNLDVLDDLDNHKADFYTQRWNGVNFEKCYHKGDYQTFINTPHSSNHREHCITNMARYKAAKAKLKLTKVSEVIRIPIRDIQEWEISLLERK